MTRPKRKRAAKGLENACAQFLAALHKELGKLSDADIQKAIEHIDGYTSTNCAWYAYHLRHFMREVIDDHLRARQDAKINELEQSAA